MILVMHRHTDFRTALVRLLQCSGLDAVGFEAGQEGMAAMCRQRPRLLILNGALCDMDGIELLRMVRANEALADLPVFFLSGNEDRKAEAERLGIAEYFLKPLDPDRFIHSIKRTRQAAPA